MALSPDADALTDEHRRHQAAVSAWLIGQLAQTWPRLDPSRLDASRDAWLRDVVLLVAQGYNASAALAAAYLPAFRALEGVPGTMPLPDVRPLDVRATVAAQALLGPIGIKSNLAKGLDLDEALRIAEGRTIAAAQSAAANGGRGLVLDAVAADPKALGWARVASSGACGFCAMLCSRGPVYRSERTSAFRPHPGCNCVAEAVYSSSPDAWTPIARQYEEEWVAASLTAELDAAKTSDTRRADRRKRGGDAARRAAMRAYRRGEGVKPPPLEQLGRQPTQRERDALNAYRRHLYSQRTTGRANARRADQLEAKAVELRAKADAKGQTFDAFGLPTPGANGFTRSAELAEQAAARARANTPAASPAAAVKAADAAAAAARAQADRLLAQERNTAEVNRIRGERSAADAADRAAAEAALVRAEEEHLAAQAAKAADGAELDDQGHPWTLTAEYLEDLTEEQVDSLVDYCAEGVSTDNPLELRRWEDLEAWLDYRDRYDAIVEQAGKVADAAIDRELADLLRTHGRPGLTHTVSEAELIEAAVTRRPTRREVQRDYAVYLEELYVRAQDATRGSLVNNKGRARGISGYELLKGDVRRLLRYGSEELLEFFEDPANRRVQWSEFYAERTGSQAFAELAAKQADRNARIDRDRNGVQ